MWLTFFQTQAPECLNERRYSRQSDVYAFAITLIEMLSQNGLYPGEDVLQIAIQVVQNGKRPEIPTRTNPQLAELIKKCWDQDPQQVKSVKD